MEITEFVEKNASLLRLGLHLEYNDARHRIANHLQRNIDRSKYLIYEDTQQTHRFSINTVVFIYFLLELVWSIYFIFDSLLYFCLHWIAFISKLATANSIEIFNRKVFLLVRKKKQLISIKYKHRRYCNTMYRCRNKFT